MFSRKPFAFLAIPDRPPNYYENEARKRFLYWRLVYEGGIPPSEVDLMDWDELLEASAALDMFPKKGGGLPWPAKP